MNRVWAMNYNTNICISLKKLGSLEVAKNKQSGFQKSWFSLLKVCGFVECRRLSYPQKTSAYDQSSGRNRTATERQRNGNGTARSAAERQFRGRPVRLVRLDIWLLTSDSTFAKSHDITDIVSESRVALMCVRLLVVSWARLIYQAKHLAS